MGSSQGSFKGSSSKGLEFREFGSWALLQSVRGGFGV